MTETTPEPPSTPHGDAPEATLVHDLTRADLLGMYRALRRARAAEERLEILFTQGHIGGGLYRSLGQEAGAVGAAWALRRRDDGTGDIVAQTIRATGAVFVMGGTPLQYFRQYLARATGPTRGKEANVHWVDYRRGLIGPVSPLGTMVEVMAGITLSFKLRGEDRVGIVFYGDGASSTGAWHEGLAFAASQRCPMVLMVEANQWAFSTPTHRNTRVESFTEKAPGYGLHAASVDGTDVLAVYEAVKGVVARARAGEGTGMVELRYYRRKGHAQHDAQEYVDPEELAYWETRDPITRFHRTLVERGWADEEVLASIAAEAEEEARTAAEQALSEPRPEGPEALENVYTDLRVPGPWTRHDQPDPHLA
ncbi:MAG: thiamine pyrophosphate-dependent dehydrogenase E1 component subunit alpha [Gemmatimonadetes bacterium]|nr:MAG: thiamine pyrophosphate-dependent dehydrogenase E1 component subunit alpha [Gemmatimonadota bacterium]